MARDRNVQHSRLEIDDGSAHDPRGRPTKPRVLHEQASGEVAELAEVRAVELEEVTEVLADVAAEGDAGSPEEQVVARVPAIRRTRFIQDELRLQLQVQVEGRLGGRQRYADRVRRDRREEQSEHQDQSRGNLHRAFSVELLAR